MLHNNSKVNCSQYHLTDSALALTFIKYLQSGPSWHLLGEYDVILDPRVLHIQNFIIWLSNGNSVAVIVNIIKLIFLLYTLIIFFNVKSMYVSKVWTAMGKAALKFTNFFMTLDIKEKKEIC